MSLLSPFPWTQRFQKARLPQILVLGAANDRQRVIANIVHHMTPAIPNVLVCALPRIDYQSIFSTPISQMTQMDEIRLMKEVQMQQKKICALREGDAADVRQLWILDGCFMQYQWAETKCMQFANNHRNALALSRIIGLPMPTPVPEEGFELLFLIPNDECPLSKKGFKKVFRDHVKSLGIDESNFLAAWEYCYRKNQVCIVDKQEGLLYVAPLH